MQEKYDKYIQAAKPTKEFTLICAQVRIGGARPHVKDDLMFTARNETVKFWDYIKENFIPKVKFADKYKIFITTDTESVQTEASEVFGDKLFTTNGLFVHIDRDGTREDCSRFDKVVLDFYLYRNCDMSVYTKNSSYGRYSNYVRYDFRKYFYPI